MILSYELDIFTYINNIIISIKSNWWPPCNTVVVHQLKTTEIQK